MKISSQILADKYIGLPLGVLMNVFVRLVGQVLHINHRLDRKFERIAIVKYKGLGSIVQATPLIKTLKDNYPDAEITFITSVQNRSLVEMLPQVSKGIYFDDRNALQALLNLPHFIWQLWQRRFQLLFDLELYSNISSIISTLSCATNRFGYYLSASQYRMGLYTHMMFFNTRCPLSETYLQLARSLQLEASSPKPIPFALENNGDILGRLGIDQPYFVINVNASDLRVERRWPAALFAEFSDKLQEIYPSHKQVFVGSIHESDYVNDVISLKSKKDQNCISVAGKTSLSELINVITKATLMISCDTGPAHLAYAQNTPSVILFGPVAPSQFYIPENVGVLYKNLYCSPCIHEFDVPPCKGDNQCMKMIAVEEVMQMVKKVLQDGYKRLQHPEEVKYLGGQKQALGKVVR